MAVAKAIFMFLLVQSLELVSRTSRRSNFLHVSSSSSFEIQFASSERVSVFVPTRRIGSYDWSRISALKVGTCSRESRSLTAVQSIKQSAPL